MKSSHWKPKQNIETRFAHDIFEIVTKYFSETKAKSFEPVRTLGLEWLDKYAWQAAQRMITGLLVSSNWGWRIAAKESMRGAEIYSALKTEMHGKIGKRVRQLIAGNAELIKSLPADVALQASKQANKSYQEGQRFEAIERFIPHTIRWKARLVARTETSKASTALTQARSEDLGLSYYLWETSSDARVRPAHRLMQGVIIPWSTPPSPEQLYGIRSALGHYNAGDAPNCRCYPAPVINVSHVKFPHRFYDGKIRTITLAEFRKIANLPLAA